MHSGAKYNTGGSTTGQMGAHQGAMALKHLAHGPRASRVKAEKHRLKGTPWRTPPKQYTARNLETRGYGNIVGLA